MVLILCPVKEWRGSASLNMGCLCRARQSFLQKSSLINVRQAPVSTRECATNDLVNGTSMQTLVSGALTSFPLLPPVSSSGIPVRCVLPFHTQSSLDFCPDYMKAYETSASEVVPLVAEVGISPEILPVCLFLYDQPASAVPWCCRKVPWVWPSIHLPSSSALSRGEVRPLPWVLWPAVASSHGHCTSHIVSPGDGVSQVSRSRKMHLSPDIPVPQSTNEKLHQPFHH